MPSKLPPYTGSIEEQQAAAGRAALQSLREFLAERGAELPEGFQASVHLRKESSSPGAVDVYYFDHHNNRYRSKLQVARALGLVDSKDETGSLPGSPRVMGANACSPAAADEAGQQPPAHHPHLPAHANQEQGGGFVGNEEEVKVMAALSKYLAKLGGQLAPGWRCQVRKRAGPGNRIDTYFCSPAGVKFRSKTDVARHLGLTVPVARRPGGAPPSPGVDVNMAEEDVAAMLMALPHGTPLTAREAARARKLSGAAARPDGGWAAGARGPDTPENGGDRSSNGLHSIAAVLDEASPFYAKQEAQEYAEEEQFYDSDDEDTDARADEKAELAARQMRRLRAAAQANGITLGPGWRVDVSIRKNGTSKGSTDYYYRLQGGGTFRSITAAIKHLLSAGDGAAPAAAANAPNPAPAPAEFKPQPPQQGRPPNGPSRPASPIRAAPGSPRPPTPGSPADAGGPAGPGAKATPKKFGSLAALSQPSAAPRQTSAADSIAKGKRPAVEAPFAAAAPPRPGTKAALAAMGRDASASGDLHDGKKGAAGAEESDVEAGTADGAPESDKPGPSGKVPDDEAGASAGGNAAWQEEATKNEPTSRKRRRKPDMKAAQPKEESAFEAPAARRRRAVNRGRMDYATIAAMADLQYALSTEDRRATLRKRNTGKSNTPEGATDATASEDKEAAKSTAAPFEPTNGRSQWALEGASRGEEAEQKQKKAERKRERVVTPYTKLVNRVRGLISRIRVEEAYLDAYEGEGWRGANREKLRPTTELEQARLQIEKCKLGMREAVKECEESNGDRAIPAEHIDEDGEIDEQHILCGRCCDPESYEDNDIILCDGNCHRAYHEKCLVPPLDSSTLPEDEGWLCPACDAKADILNMINEEYGFEYEQETPWHAIFAEAPVSPRAAADGAAAAPVSFKTLADFLAHADLPDSDADDSSFKDDSGSKQEEGGDAVQGGSGDEQGSDSDSDAGSGTSEGSSVESMASDEREGLQAMERAAGEGRPQRMRRLRSTIGAAPAGKRQRTDADEDADVDDDKDDDVDADEEEEGVVLAGKRTRTAVDYRKLNREMFGDFESYEGEAMSDEDFTPRKAEAEAAAVSP